MLCGPKVSPCAEKAASTQYRRSPVCTEPGGDTKSSGIQEEDSGWVWGIREPRAPNRTATVQEPPEWDLARHMPQTTRASSSARKLVRFLMLLATSCLRPSTGQPGCDCWLPLRASGSMGLKSLRTTTETDGPTLMGGGRVSV